MRRRRQLFEFNEADWFPQWLRDGQTDALEAIFRLTGLFRGAPALLAELLVATGERRIVDLCSGSGGPLPSLVSEIERRLGSEIEVVLTDKFPNLDAFERHAQAMAGRIAFVRDPVDALHPPAELEGVRTVFDAFHHLRPDEAEKLLQQAVEDGTPIAIFDVAGRRWLHLLSCLLLPLAVLVVTPWIRPLRARRLLFTYLLPVIPLTVCWDGVVSHLRAHDHSEIARMLAPLQERGFDWHVEGIGRWPMVVTAVLGRPRQTGAGDSGRDAELLAELR